MEEAGHRIAADVLKEFVVAVLVKMGLPEKDAALLEYFYDEVGCHEVPPFVLNGWALSCAALRRQMPLHHLRLMPGCFRVRSKIAVPRQLQCLVGRRAW
jgi:hypothetical protein